MSDDRWPEPALEWFERQPRVKFVCRRDWLYGPDTFEIGVYWDKTKDPIEGCLIYDRWFSIRFRFAFWISRSLSKDTP